MRSAFTAPPPETTGNFGFAVLLQAEQMAFYCFPDIIGSFETCLSLGDAARQSGTSCDESSVLILLKTDAIFHRVPFSQYLRESTRHCRKLPETAEGGDLIDAAQTRGEIRVTK